MHCTAGIYAFHPW